MTFRETKAKVKAKRIRRAIARMYDKNPDQALAHVNAELTEASQAEERRAAFLMGVEA